MLSAAARQPATLSATDDGRLLLRCPYEDRHRAKGVEGWSWSPFDRAWEYPCHRATLAALVSAFPGMIVDERIEHQLTGAVARPDWSDAEPAEPMPVRATPYRHQIAAFNRALVQRHTALLMDMRTGKSMSTIATFGRRFLRGEIKRVLVVAPTSVVPEWRRQIAEFADFPHDVLMLSGTIAKRAQRLAAWGTNPERLAIALVNYEAVAAMVSDLKSWAPQLIVADESQRIKNSQALVSKAMHFLARGARHRLILTGTPVTQSPADLFSQYKFLDPDLFGHSFAVFRAKYIIMGGFNDRQIVGYRNLDDLTARAHSVAFRVRLADTYDMPEAVESARHCELEPAAARAYRQLLKESAAELGRERHVTADNVLTRLLRLQQMAGGFVEVEDDESGARHVEQVSRAKLGLLRETLEDVLADDAGRKVVIFARFLREVEAILRILAELGIGAVSLTGATKDRAEVVRRFREEPAVRAFVGQIQTAGVGIPLDVADTAIFYSTTFSFADYDQARSRIKAVGKATPRHHIHLLASGTVDEHVQQALARKRNVADDVVDRWRELFHGDDRAIRVQETT